MDEPPASAVRKTAPLMEVLNLELQRVIIQVPSYRWIT